MKTYRSAVPFAVLALTMFGAGVTPGSAQSANADVSSPAKPRRAGRRPVPERFIITAQRLPDALPESVRLGRSRLLPAFDAYGTPVAPDAPRLATGSLIPQKFEVVGAGAANTASPLFIYTQGDLRTGGVRFLGGPFGQSYADQQTRLTVPRYALDLHRIPPEKRMAVLTQLIGSERARQAMDEAYANATITR